MQFEYTGRYPAKVPVDVAVTELERLKEPTGRLTPELVVDASRPSDAPLHPVFEWDDGKAAEAFRRSQAGNLIRSIRIVTESGDELAPTYIRAFIHTDGPENEGGYHSTAQVMSSDELRREAIDKAVEYLNSARRRLAEFRELAKFHSDIEKVAQGLENYQSTESRKLWLHEPEATTKPKKAKARSAKAEATA
jgi:hypothetical protein